jgi:hypothetical protein
MIQGIYMLALFVEWESQTITVGEIWASFFNRPLLGVMAQHGLLMTIWFHMFWFGISVLSMAARKIQ